MYKTLGDYSWSDLFRTASQNVTSTIENSPVISKIEPASDEEMTLDESILASAKELQTTIHGLKEVR